MRLVNWSEILPGTKMKVLFSALALPPHIDQIDANLAAIELPGDLFIDVEWVRKIGRYIVTLFREDIDNVISVRECKDAYAVIEAVCWLIFNAQAIDVGGGTFKTMTDSNVRPPVVWNAGSAALVLGTANA